MANVITLGDQALNLQVIKQHTSVVVEPTSQMGGDYDTAEITTVLVVNNPLPEAQEIEFIVPYETQSFSASVAVISAGAEEYHNRSSSLGKISGNLERIKPYLAKMLLPADQFDTAKELKLIAKQFRAGVVAIPTGQITIKIQVSAIVNPVIENNVNLYKFRAYSPLPGVNVGGGRVALTLSARFVGDETIHPQITKSQWSNPYGDSAGAVDLELPAQSHGEDTILYWKWHSDPVVDFEYHY